MKFTVKMNFKNYTLTENDRIMFNGVCYILVTQKVLCGYFKCNPTVPKKHAEKWIKDGALVKCGTCKYTYDEYPLYRFMKEV